MVLCEAELLLGLGSVVAAAADVAEAIPLEEVPLVRDEKSARHRAITLLLRLREFEPDDVLLLASRGPVPASSVPT